MMARRPGLLVFLAFATLASACAVAGDGQSPDDLQVGPIDGDAGDSVSLDGGASSNHDGASQQHADASQAADSSPGVDSGSIADSAVGVDSSTHVDSGGNTMGCTYSGALVTFDLSAEAGNETSASPSATASGMMASALSRSSSLTAVSGSASLNSSGWPTGGSPDNAHYVSFTIAPPASCSLTLTALAVDVRASATGPANAAAATSDDNFATHTAFASTTASSVTIPSSAGSSAAIEVRIYGYGATSATGTLRVQNTLSLSGALH